MTDENQKEQQVVNQTIIVEQPKKKNGIGTAGFVLALIGAIFCWVPILGWILWALGLLFSFIGVFKTPKGLSIAGLIVSCIALIILIVLIVVAASAATALGTFDSFSF